MSSPESPQRPIREGASRPVEPGARVSRENTLQLQPGIRAYPMPELGRQNPLVGWSEIKAPSVEEAGVKINEVITSITEQGGRLIGVLPVEVDVPRSDDNVAGGTRTHNFLIVEQSATGAQPQPERPRGDHVDKIPPRRPGGLLR